MGREPTLSRRGLLRTAAGTTAVAAGTAGATGEALAAKPGFDGWLSGTSNYDGVVDRTGSDTVTVDVGVSGNGGNFGFGPAAVRVSPGTTVRWEWTGKGNQHTVTAQTGGSFDSGLHQEAGFTFEQTFEESGVVEYFCKPHGSIGMRGVVVVGDVQLDAGGGSSSGAGGPSGGGGQAGGGGQSGSGYGSSGGGGGAATLPVRFGFVGIAAGGFMVVLVGSMLALTAHSIRSDRHSPGRSRED